MGSNGRGLYKAIHRSSLLLFDLEASYPPRILDILRTEIEFEETYVIADVGSGTGLLSQLFLENGNPVLAVEPNEEMSGFAKQTLAKFPKFLSVKGTAEHTGIESASVDLVTVGQALHWFDCEAASVEFSRILKTNGHVCIVYNDRNNEDSFMKAMIKSLENTLETGQTSQASMMTTCLGFSKVESIRSSLCPTNSF